MNIVQLSKYYPPTMGGVELVAKMISKAHCINQDKVEIVSFGKTKEKYKGEFGEEVFQIPTNLVVASAPISLSFIFQFKRWIRSRDIDRLYVHLPNPYMHHLIWSQRKYLKRRGIKVYAVYHSDLVNQKLTGPIYNVYFRWTMSVYDGFICSSEKLWKTSNILAKTNISKYVIPFCIDHEIGFKLRRNFSKNLLAIGRLVPYKGFEFLVNTLRGTDYKLKIIGDGPQRQTLENLKSENIEILGRVSHEEKERLISEADLLIMSSTNRSEAYGMIIVEAFENGLPVVAANINSGVTFLVEGKKRGEVFEPLNSKELINKLKLFESEPELLETYSKAVREFYDDHLSFSRFSEKLLALK